jgi:peptidoglycan-associated lipoprotein
MKKSYQSATLICSIVCLLCATGCKKKSGGVWDDNKTSSHYKNKLNALWGGDDAIAAEDGFIGPSEEDFIALKEEDLQSQFSDGAIPQPDMTPGEEGSGIPGISHFKTPTSQLAAIFRNVLFNTDDHILRGREHLETIENVSSYLKDHPETYIFVEGHADERGPEAYNLSLGARRANYIRTLLVQKGVNPNQIHTISYGKEKPADESHSPQAWSRNRRGQFKIYQKS